MFKKKCPSCEEKIERKFSYCPWCGHSFKKQNEEDMGFLGSDDSVEPVQNQMNLPFGFNGIINSLMKQIEKEMSGSDIGKSPMPKGFKIQISHGMPQNMQVVQNRREEKNPLGNSDNIPLEEQIRRAGLKRVEAKSTIRRLPEGVIYEIDAPGVKYKSDIALTKMENSSEIKIYGDKCYVKAFPMRIDFSNVVVKKDKVFLKIKE